MQTPGLIDLLAASHRPVDRGRLARLTALAAIASAVLVALALGGTLGFRPDLAPAMAAGVVPGKMAFGLAIALASLAVFVRSLKPAMPARRLLGWLALPGGAALAAAGLSYAAAPVDGWADLTFGRNWLACLIAVPLYALIPFTALVLIGRQGAPVAKRLTGLAAGLAAGGLAMTAYALHCPDDTAPFVAAWYGLAGLITGVLGALIAPKLLRW